MQDRRRHLASGHVEGGLVEQGGAVGREQRVELAAQRDIAGAGRLEERRAVGDRPLNRLVINPLDDRPAISVGHDLPLHFALEPGLGQSPVAEHRLWRDVEDIRHVVDAESSEEPELDHSGLSLVSLGERLQRVIEAHNRALRETDHRFVKRDRPRRASALLAPVRPCVVHEDLSHESRRERVEVAAVAAVHRTRTDEP